MFETNYLWVFYSSFNMPYLKYITVILASTLKFLGGPIAGISLGLNWIETAICAATGMMFTVFVAMFTGGFLWKKWQDYQSPKLFSKRTRYAVKIWKRFGIKGIAFLTPLIFTPIGGTLIAVSFKVNRTTIFLWMLVSAIFWGIVQAFVFDQIPLLRGLLV